MVVAVGNLRSRGARMRGSGCSRNMGQRCEKTATWLTNLKV